MSFGRQQVMDVEMMVSRSGQGHNDVHPVIRTLYDHIDVRKPTQCLLANYKCSSNNMHDWLLVLCDEDNSLQ